jgi:hypothetical protein
MTQIQKKAHLGHLKLEFGYCLGFGAWRLVLLLLSQPLVVILGTILFLNA